GPPLATITSTLWPTRSAANADSRSRWPSAQRYSTATFCPSTYPVSLSPCWNAATIGASGPGEARPRKPIIGIAFCCARKARPAVIAPPRAASARAASFDDLVGAGEDCGRDGQPKGFGRIEVDQLECRRLLDRQIGGLG